MLAETFVLSVWKEPKYVIATSSIVEDLAPRFLALS